MGDASFSHSAKARLGSTHPAQAQLGSLLGPTDAEIDYRSTGDYFSPKTARRPVRACASRRAGPLVYACGCSSVWVCVSACVRACVCVCCACLPASQPVSVWLQSVCPSGCLSVSSVWLSARLPVRRIAFEFDPGLCRGGVPLTACAEGHSLDPPAAAAVGLSLLGGPRRTGPARASHRITRISAR